MCLHNSKKTVLTKKYLHFQIKLFDIHVLLCNTSYEKCPSPDLQKLANFIPIGS